MSWRAGSDGVADDQRAVQRFAAVEKAFQAHPGKIAAVIVEPVAANMGVVPPLMALTISTGFVVDDAIVMIENISRYIEMGDSPMEAALKGSAEIGFTIISLTVSLIAVLIPLLFMADIVGRLFREFAVTLAVTILFSAFVSLTLTPMMAARILKHKPESQQGRLYRWSEWCFVKTIEQYGKMVRVVLRHQTLTLLVALGTLVLTIYLYDVVPKGFFPVQDR